MRKHLTDQIMGQSMKFLAIIIQKFQRHKGQWKIEKLSETGRDKGDITTKCNAGSQIEYQNRKKKKCEKKNPCRNLSKFYTLVNTSSIVLVLTS